MKWLECIPNFSEGRDQSIIDAIAEAIDSVPGVVLLHTDPGYDANRTVYTFAGLPEDVVEAAYKAIIKAAELIDMRQHQGEHPRIGACDVCPLVPLGEMTFEETLPYAIELGERLGAQNIPVYLYEKSATHPDRKALSNIRRGEYEGLKAKLKAPGWLPDYGPWTFQEQFGAMALGVRPFLVAYNINLETKDVNIAKRIAGKVRESGYKNSDGTRSPGRLKGLKAIGWWMDAYQCTQVSTNIVDIQHLSIKTVFDTVKELAAAENTRVTGSELIGLIPEQVLVDTGKAIISEDNHKEVLIEKAISYLDLNLEPQYRVLEQVIDWKLGKQA